MNTLLHGTEEYLLNSLWQAPALLCVAWLLARALRRAGPVAEHRVWVACLLLQCALPACSAPKLLPAIRGLFAGPGGHAGRVTVTMQGAAPHSGGGTALMLQAGVMLYLCVTCVLLLRVLYQCWHVWRLRVEASPLQLQAGDAAFLQRCCAGFGIETPALAAAERIGSPLTLGFRRFTIVLPTRFSGSVSEAQLHVALSHEAAHVARGDARKQLLYCLFSLPLRYHPAAWFTLARLSETRERVCDAMAAAATGNTRSYARGLLELASLLAAWRPAYPNAIGLFDANQLERRVLMLHRHSVPLSRVLRVALIGGSVAVAATACTSAVALHLSVAAPAAAIDPQQQVPSDLMAGQIVNKTTPKYPAEAKKNKMQGAVVLAATIGKTGKVEHLRIVSGPEVFRRSAIDAVKQWVYKPYLLNGDPTAVETTITVHYSLEGEAPPTDAPASSGQSSLRNFKGPELVTSVPAVYPEEAKKAKIGGEVLVAMLVGADGKVSGASALSGPEALRPAAVAAAEKYVFRPALNDGQAVPVDIKVAINFQVF